VSAAVPVGGADAAPHLAANVYHWGHAHRRRLLVECLGPLARALRGDGLVRRFLYAGFDARGPHLFVVLTPADGARDAVEARLRAALDAYLALHPSDRDLAPDELRLRHDECRGKRLCALDGEDGFAPNNTYAIRGHGADGYPFRVGGGGELWDGCGEMALWAVDQLRQGGEAGAAARWTAAVDGALERLGHPTADFFRYHAGTVLLPLAAALEADEAKVVAGLPAAVGERNRAVFDAVWRAEAARTPSAEVDRLVELAVREGASAPGKPWSLLREVNHCVLSQLQQPERSRLALWLYAWMRGVPAGAGAPG
jgi:hypothetical protein